MTASQKSLSAAIIEQERAVEEADRRLMERLVTVTNRVHTSRSSPLRNLAITVAPIAATFLFWRVRRNFGLAARVAGGGRLSVLLHTVLPLLAPVIGVRAVTLLTTLAAAPGRAVAGAPQVHPLVDLERYAGTWYEIGSTQARRERRRAEAVSATYLLDGARVRVAQRRWLAGGRVDLLRGRARVVDPVSRAKLKITFASPFLRWLPSAWSDYWILDVTPDYSRALVGTPDRRSLWVLAREASIPAHEYRHMLMQASMQGYNTGRVLPSTPRAIR